MTANISSNLPCIESELWEKINHPSSLQYVTSPVLKFVPENEELLKKQWALNTPYPLRLYLFGLIPLGIHRITLKVIDRDKNLIKSQENGTLAKVWNHTIHFHENEDGQVHYTDSIEIKAGVLTPLIWLFAQYFYRHRQKRWRQLLSQS
jgi:ligand-binding SRPBCC domain-containing protein